MPSPLIKSFAEKSNKSEKEVEALWKRAEEIAKKNGQSDNYAYIVSILKRLLKLEESFKNFQILLDKAHN